MFESSDSPRVYGVNPGVDFPMALVDGLLQRHADKPPEALARVHLIVNTRRMARRIRTLFDAGSACLLPKISLITDLGELWALGDIPDPVPPLMRRLELARLISAMLDQQPDLAPPSTLFDLSESLAALMDEMHGEGVTPEQIEALDVSDQSGHWERIKSFLGLIRPYFEANTDAPDKESRQRLVVEHLLQTWHRHPPQDPIIIAGSTGSRGATQLLMQAVSTLPQGAVILPGFDFDMPADVWDMLGNPLHSEDHPQYRFAAFAGHVGLHPQDVEPWTPTSPPNSMRNKVVSLALRPAPVTDQWLSAGPKLSKIDSAMQDVTLIEAPLPRIEALTIALRLRQAAEEGQIAALITPDRTLTRQVVAALDRWNIYPDDSAGIPLHLSPPGRFLRHVADLFRSALTAESLLTLLKHPIAHSGEGRGPHLRLTRELELHLRRHGPPYPSPEDFRVWAASQKDEFASTWAEWLCTCFTDRADPEERPLQDRISDHLDLANLIANGALSQTESRLWNGDAGSEAAKAVSELAEYAQAGAPMNARDYNSLFHSILSRKEVRNPQDSHPNILIWGTLEARVHGAELMILAGLNEGSWPETPTPDPWLNRTMRHQAGLLLPERRIGLSAHDFQQAALAPQVWLTRSIRSDDAETIPSRWLNRLQNLLAGLPDQAGVQALEDMHGRGRHWLSLANALETPKPVPASNRPSPRPPAEARPRQLSVTEIKRLIRDPYAIYARHTLGLRPLDALMKMPDALLRGIVLHSVLEKFVRETKDDVPAITKERLMATTGSVLAEHVPWAEARALWLARMERVADWFIENELARRTLMQPIAFEAKSAASLPNLDFTLTAQADRIDIDQTGQLHIYDYKTGTPPTKKQQNIFDKQLLLESVLAQISGFGEIDPTTVARAVFIGLASGGSEVDAPIEEESPEKIWAEFQELITAYLQRDLGFTSRRALQKSTDRGDYDQLARFGEWDIADEPAPEDVG